MEPILQVSHLSKTQILQDISLQLASGEMLGIMGPSGSGKSTLLYNIAGLDQPSQGEVWLGDVDVARLSEDQKASLRLHDMGFVFQQMNMMANLNLLDNITAPAKWANSQKSGKRKAELENKAKALMKKLSISGLENRSITEVSGGQLQRACICRSLINDPKILFADEPTGALNQRAAKEVMIELSKLHQEGTSILLVTHDSKVASQCDRILYLLDGQIQGELKLKKMMDPKEREEQVNAWLRSMGW
ncbi:ABC transporter ATP-binding protein [Erysipelotrichaceae bacterium RD49]|nr:ABC transporter ATP-binding protein [Erysipelotrichaceae bacterium RD49]